jgi:hypothetical protein
MNQIKLTETTLAAMTKKELTSLALARAGLSKTKAMKMPKGHLIRAILIGSETPLNEIPEVVQDDDFEEVESPKDPTFVEAPDFVLSAEEVIAAATPETRELTNSDREGMNVAASEAAVKKLFGLVRKLRFGAETAPKKLATFRTGHLQKDYEKTLSDSHYCGQVCLSTKTLDYGTLYIIATPDSLPQVVEAVLAQFPAAGLRVSSTPRYRAENEYVVPYSNA